MNSQAKARKTKASKKVGEDRFSDALRKIFATSKAEIEKNSGLVKRRKR